MRTLALKLFSINFILAAIMSVVASSTSPAQVAATVAQQIFGSSSNTTQNAKLTTFSQPQKGYTTAWSNVRSQPGTSAKVLRTYEPFKNLDLYGSVNGTVVWDNIATWYLVSEPGKDAEYIYGGLIASGEYDDDVSSVGKEIIVSLSKQQLEVYDSGIKLKTFLATTGQPDLPTPTGSYKVFLKQSPTTFVSPWPQGSPYYYPPTHINYGMEFKEGGFYIHDATWRSVFGPGTNTWHNDPVYGQLNGTHGCVNLSINDMSWLYNWTPNGTSVRIIN